MSRGRQDGEFLHRSVDHRVPLLERDCPPRRLVGTLDEEHRDLEAGGGGAEIDVLDLGVQDAERVHERSEDVDLVDQGVLADEQVLRHLTLTLVVRAVIIRVDGLFVGKGGLVVQEALTNAVKHAGQARIDVSLSCDTDHLKVVVVDDGIGTAASGAPAGGRGIVGMSERAAMLGGTLSAGPGPDGGFRVEALIYVGESTVKTHVKRILMKLALRDRVHAIVFAYETGLLVPGDEN